MGRRGWTGGEVRGAPLVVGTLGVALIVATAAYALVFFPGALRQSLGRPSLAVVLRVVAVALILAFSTATAYAGYGLHRSEFSNEQRWWVTLWTAMGLGGALAAVVLVQANRALNGQGLSRQALVAEILLGASGGSVVGLLAGLTNARLRRQRAETVAQRDTFRFLNQLLRHHILNGIQEIRGYAGFLHDADPDELERIVSRIEDRTDHMTHVVEDLQTLIHSTAGEADLRPVNVSRILTEEIESAAIRYPDAEFEADLAENAHVRANEFLRTAYRNLLSDVVERNTADTPRVEVSMEVTPEVVIVTISDNSPAMAAPYREHLSGDPPRAGWNPDRAADGDLGLTLARRLVDLYDGRVQALETNPHGSTLRTRLPRP